MTITVELVHATANKLVEQDIKPTLEAMRDALGGGSFTTISRHMKTWRQEQQTEQQLQKVELPTAIDTRLQSLGADMWQSAIDIANERLKAEREALAVAQAKAHEATEEALAAIEMLESEQEALLVQLDDITANSEAATADALERKSALETATVQHRSDLDAIKQQLNTTEHKLELEQQRSSTAQKVADDFRSKLGETSSQLTQSRESIATANAQSTAQQAEIKRLKAELTDTKALNDKKDAEIDKLTDERNTLNTELANKAGRLEVTIEHLETLTADYKQLTNDNKALSVDNTKLTADKDALEKTVSTLTTERDKLTTDKDALSKTVSALTAERDKLTDAINLKQK